MGGLRLWAAYVCRGDPGFVSQVAAFIVCRGAGGGGLPKRKPNMPTKPSIFAGGWEQHPKKGVALHGHKNLNL